MSQDVSATIKSTGLAGVSRCLCGDKEVIESSEGERQKIK